MQPLPDSQNPDSLVEVCRLLSPSGFYPLVSGLLGLVGNKKAGIVVTPNASPYLLGQIGLVGNVAKSSPFSPVYFERKPYLLGQIGLVGNS